MNRGPLDSVLRHLRQLVAPPEGREATDQQLLQSFLASRDEAAFERLVHRHGPMVSSVCRRLLRNEHDSDDVFQATFLVLLRKAGSIRKQASLSSWLHGVAHRIARKAQVNAARRLERKKQATPTISSDSNDASLWRDLRTVLDEELDRLPEKYRAPLVLCYLEGRTYTETAQQLGWTHGTVCGRLARARELLRNQLVRRGVALSAATLTLALEQSAQAAVPAPLVGSVMKLATLVRLGEEVAVPAAELAQAALKAMSLARLKMAAAVFMGVTFLASGAGVLAHHVLAVRTPLSDPAEPLQAAASVAKAQPAADKQARTDRYGDPLPPGAIARLGTVRFRHEDRVEEFAFSPDGQILASAAGRAIYLWEPDTGKVLRRITGHEEDVKCLAWAPDGKRLASGSGDNTIRLWDAATGKELRRLEGHQGDFWRMEGGVSSVVFGAGGARLVSCGGDKTIRLWDTATGKELLQFARPSGSIWRLVASSDGNTVAAICWEADKPGLACFWDIATGKEILRLTDAEDLFDIAISPDGKVAATAGGRISKPCVIRLWDVDTGTELRSLKGHDDRIHCVAFSADGRHLVTGGYDKTLRLWDVRSGKELSRLNVPHTPLYQAAFCPDGRTIAWRGFEHVIRFWDTTTGSEPRAFSGHQEGISSLAVSPDGRLIASAGMSSIRLWDVAERKELRIMRGQQSSVTGVFFSPDGKTLVSGSYDNTVRIWEVATGKELGRMKARGIEALALSPDGKKVAAWGHDDAQVRLLDMETGKELHNWKSNHVGSLAFSPDGKFLAEAGGTDLLVHVREVATAKELVALGKHHGGLTAAAFSPDGKNLVVACMDHSLTLWELATGRERLVVQTGNNIYGLALSPDGRLVATVNNGRSRISVGPPPGKTSDVGNEDKDKVRVWDLATGREVRRFAGHLGGTTAVAFSPDSKLLISGSADTTVLLWDAADLVPAERSGRVLTAAEQESLWSDLAGPDAAKAHRAIWSMRAAPQSSVAFLKERLRPVVRAEPQRVAQLLTNLNDDRFAVREQARQELEKMGESAASALRKALDEKPPLEARRRVEQLLAKLQDAALRNGRAIELLEQIPTDEAKQLLQSLSEGAAGGSLTQEAQAALERQRRRTKARE